MHYYSKVWTSQLMVVASILLVLVFGTNSALGGCVCTGSYSGGRCDGNLVVDGDGTDIVR